MSRALGLLLVLGACKAELAGGTPGDGGDDQPSPDAADPVLDSTTGSDAAPLGPWSTPQPVAGAMTIDIADEDPALSADGLELIFKTADPLDANRAHLYRMRRTDALAPWSAPARLGVTALGSADQTPVLSANGLTLYFASNRGGAGVDTYTATRGALTDDFSGATPLLEANSAKVDKWLAPCAGGRYVMISQRGADTTEDLYEGVLGAQVPVRLAISSTGGERGVWLSSDCRTLLFGGDRDGTYKIYEATRMSPTDPWSAPQLVADFAMLGGDLEDPFLSADGRTFVLTSNVAGSKDLYISTR